MKHHYPKMHIRIRFWNALEVDVSGYTLCLLELSQVSFMGLGHSSTSSLHPFWPLQDLPSCIWPSRSCLMPWGHWHWPCPELAHLSAGRLGSGLHSHARFIPLCECHPYSTRQLSSLGDREWNGFFQPQLFGGRNKCHLTMAFLLPSYL